MFKSKYILLFTSLFLINFFACDDSGSTKNEICNNAADDDGDGLIDCDDPDCQSWSGCQENNTNTNNSSCVGEAPLADMQEGVCQGTYKICDSNSSEWSILIIQRLKDMRR